MEALCDRVTVLRNGVKCGEMEKPFNRDALLDMMFDGQPLVSTRTSQAMGEPVLTFEGVSAMGGRSGLKSAV